jgi:Fur family ferric uptake transcriptional regulator
MQIRKLQMKRQAKQKSKTPRCIGASGLLDSAGLYKTIPRLAVLDILLNAARPLTQNQIAQRLGKGRFDKATIYRTLEGFSKTGLVHKVFLQDRIGHFELAHNCTEKQCHPHFTCTGCGDTHCMTDILLPMAKSPYRGFIIRHQRVQLEGLCPKCSPPAPGRLQRASRGL